MATSTRRESEAEIDPQTRMGTVRLTVSDLARGRSFYEQVVGLQATELEAGGVGLGVGTGSPPLVELFGDASAPRLDPRTTGLFHLAVLVPSRLDLAYALGRLAESRWPLDGASDHLVSEALYLSDPDGNGIEIYRDRPREQWRREGETLAMATLPLDLRSVASEIETDGGGVRSQTQAPAGTTIGHVHLQVTELDRIEAFYAGVLGFDVTVRGYPGALFVSAGGYHHHVGLNTWHSAGSGPPEPGAVGLRSFDVLLPSQAELDQVLARVSNAGLALEPGDTPGAHIVRDPSGNAVELRVA